MKGKVLVFVAVLIFVGLLTAGCGATVPQEEHDEVVAELAACQAEVERAESEAQEAQDRAAEAEAAAEAQAGDCQSELEATQAELEASEGGLLDLSAHSHLFWSSPAGGGYVSGRVETANCHGASSRHWWAPFDLCSSLFPGITPNCAPCASAALPGRLSCGLCPEPAGPAL